MRQVPQPLRTLGTTAGLPPEQAARQQEVDNLLLNMLLRGQQPTPAVRAQLANYVAGQLSRKEAFAGLQEVPMGGHYLGQ
jgi:hypothetical protein